MEFLKICVKILFLTAMVLLIAAPFFFEHWNFKKDKKNKISYKRFRVALFAVVYAIVMTVTMYLLKEFWIWLEGTSFIQWLNTKLAPTDMTKYAGKIFVTIFANILIGVLFSLLLRLVKIGLKKKDLVKPKGKDGAYTWAQKFERKVIKFFHSETWFFVGKMLKWLNIFLSVAYALMFALYQIPALFTADWIPYEVISALFTAGYVYPTITLIVTWQCYYFLQGIQNLINECPEMLEEDTSGKKKEADLNLIDQETQKCFKDYFAVPVVQIPSDEDIISAEHQQVTRFIGQAVEQDERNPQTARELYLNSMDQMVQTDASVMINGSFFSEFAMYFLRYLSVIVARGDNVVLVCNNDTQIDQVYNYVKQGLSEISSLFCKGFKSDAVDFDDPIWRIVKISGEHDVLEEAAIDDNSILVTTLSYLCSTDFESEHSRFIHLLDTIVFVDTLNTVNTFGRQMSILNTRMRHITKLNSMLAKNGNVNEQFRVRYMSRQVRYVCFDDTRTPGLDKVLKNMLAVEFISVDSMSYSPATLLRCYNYEGTPDERGRRTCPQFFTSEEEVGVVMNMAVLCLAKGAGTVTVFADDAIPYANFAETISANMGQIAIAADSSCIKLNRSVYNPDNYSVILGIDSQNNLPAALRRFAAMPSEKPALVAVFSRPYLFRDYYVANIDKLWSSAQMTRIPVEEGTRKDIAQKILVKANAGGITEEEILRLATGIPQFQNYVKNRNINGILREILELYGIDQEDRIDLYRHFEYSSVKDFNENGVYVAQDRVLLRRQGRLFDMINGRDVVMMVLGDREIPLPTPTSRMTQNYIVGQNLLYNGDIYYIYQMDARAGKLFARLALGGRNDEAYEYLQTRDYRMECANDRMEPVMPTKHVVLTRTEGEVAVDDVFVSAFRVNTEVVTSGYFEYDPHIMAIDHRHPKYHSINDEGNDLYAKQVYRRYGTIENPTYSSDSVLRQTDLLAREKGALAMSIRLVGKFGADTNKTVALAAVMLGEIIHSMFPSVADSVVVCPVFHGEIAGEDAQRVMKLLPKITPLGQNDLLSEGDFQLLIIEDSDVDLGVVSVLMSSGDDVLNTLFSPVLSYLNWYASAAQKSDYLHYGLGHEPDCFDFDALHKLATILGDDKHDLQFVDVSSVVEYDTCDFCGKRHAKGDNIIEMDDGRKMCADCAANLVGNNKKVLKAHLDRAKIFLESTYGIVLDDDYEFCFESTVKITNTLKRNRALLNRGSDVPLKSYVEDKKVHVEYSIPSGSLSELLVRELTHVWQLRHIPDVAEDLAEGHMALVSLQYLRFLKQDSLVRLRSSYYESTDNSSGEGYRKLVKALLANPKYNNNPFRYLLEATGRGTDDAIAPPAPSIIASGNFGKPYTAQNPDRCLDGTVSYFYYDRLTTSMQNVYNTMLEAIRNHVETLIVDTCSFEDLEKVADAIRYDHPELFYFITFAARGNEVMLKYGATAEEAELLNRRMEEVIPKYLEGIDDSMSAYDVAIRLHARVIQAVDYDTIALEQETAQGGPDQDSIDYLRTICGVFLDGKAVCEGYARALQLLLQRCGIECAEAAGFIRKENGESAGGHAWNLLKIDGDYYHLDVTWDDRSNTTQTVKKTDFGFGYFCITTDEALRTRDVTLCPVEMPVCTAVRANYYTHNELVLDRYDLAKIKTIATAAAEGEGMAFTFKCTSRKVYDEAVARLCADGQDCGEVLKVVAKKNKQIQTNTYGYTCDANLFIITITFKTK